MNHVNLIFFGHYMIRPWELVQFIEIFCILLIKFLFVIFNTRNLSFCDLLHLLNFPLPCCKVWRPDTLFFIRYITKWIDVFEAIPKLSGVRTKILVFCPIVALDSDSDNVYRRITWSKYNSYYVEVKSAFSLPCGHKFEHPLKPSLIVVLSLATNYLFQ